LWRGLEHRGILTTGTNYLSPPKANKRRERKRQSSENNTWGTAPTFRKKKEGKRQEGKNKEGNRVEGIVVRETT